MTLIPNRAKWSFSQYDNFILKDKKQLIDYHILDALSRTLRMFEYEGLPDTIPERELEKIIQLYGFCYFLEKDNQLYVFYGGLGGQPNEYYQPTEFFVSNAYLKFFKSVEVNKDGVLLWNDYAHMGMYPRLRRYAEFMAECDLTLRFGLINARIVSILEAKDDKQYEEVQLYLNDIEEGTKLGVILGNSFESDDKGFKVNEYRKATSENIKDIIELQQYIKASFYNEIGLQANYNMKREAINSFESGMNEEILIPLVEDMLHTREEAIKEVNKRYNLNIKVSLSKAWKGREHLDIIKPTTENKEGELEDETN